MLLASVLDCLAVEKCEQRHRKNVNLLFKSNLDKTAFFCKTGFSCFFFVWKENESVEQTIEVLIKFLCFIWNSNVKKPSLPF